MNRVMQEQKFDSFEKKVERHLTEGAERCSDFFKFYSRQNKLTQIDVSNSCSLQEAEIRRPWMHTSLKKLKRRLIGTDHNLKNIYLQIYLNAFSYETRQLFHIRKLFDRLKIISVDQPCYVVVKTAFNLDRNLN